MTTRHLTIVVAAVAIGCGESSPVSPSAVEHRVLTRAEMQAMAAAPRIAPVVPLAPVLTVTEEDICPPLPDGRRTHPDIPVPPEDAYPGRWGEPYRPPLIDPQDGSLADELDAADPDRIRNPYRDVEPESLGVITNPCPGRTVVDIGQDDVWTEGGALEVINEPITQEPSEPAAQAFIFQTKKYKLETGFLGDPATDWIVPGKTKINVRGEGWNDSCDRSKVFGCYWDIKEGEVVHLSFYWPAEAPRPDWRGDPDCDDGVVTMTQDIDCTGWFFAAPLPPPQPIPVDTVHEEAQRAVPPVGTPQPPPVEACHACAPRIWLNTANLPANVTLTTELWGIALGVLLSTEYSTGTEWQRLQHWAAAIWLSEQRFSKVNWVRGQVIQVVEALRTASDSEQSTQRQSYNRLIDGAPDGCPLQLNPVVG